jgi:hypothetical protein
MLNTYRRREMVVSDRFDSMFTIVSLLCLSMAFGNMMLRPSILLLNWYYTHVHVHVIKDE